MKWLGDLWKKLWSFVPDDPAYPLTEGESGPTETDLQRERAERWDREGG